MDPNPGLAEGGEERQKSAASFLSRSLSTFSSRLMDLPTRYGLHFLVAARLPIAQVGEFYIVFSMCTMLSGFGRNGIDRALTREIAAAMGHNQPEVARKAIRHVFASVLTQSIAISLVTALLARILSKYAFHDPALLWPLILGVLSIIPQNVSVVAAGALLGYGRIATSQMIHQWLWPGVFCVCALVMHLDVHRALAIIVLAMTVNALVGLWLMVRVMPPKQPHTEPVAVPPMFKLGLQLFTSELVQLAISSLPPFVIGLVATTVDVGRYALAWRIVLMLNLLVSAMGAVVQPQFARAGAVGDKETLRRVSAQTVGLTTALCTLPAIFLAINPGFFLSRFGPGYAGAAPAMRALLVGQYALVLCAGVPELLGMTGHAKALLHVNVVSAIVLVCGLFMLTPHFADFGAAMATALTMLLNAVGVTYYARRDLGLVPLKNFLRDLRGMVASAIRPVAS